MYTYVCCRCKNCSAQIVLEDRGDSDTNLPERPPRPRADARRAHLGCRTVSETGFGTVRQDYWT
jgi:hypothetical protein